MAALTFTGDGLNQRFANQLGVLGADACPDASMTLFETRALRL